MVQYLDATFGSLSDPTRRDILQRLTGGELSAGEIAQRYDMTLTGVLKHLRILERAGLITLERHGRQQFARLSWNAFRNASEYIQNYELLLTNRLDALEWYIREGRIASVIPIANRRKEAGKMKDHILTVTHTFDAPREEVWDAYTNRDYVPMWWGSAGTRLISCAIEARPGGVWRFVAQDAVGLEHVFSGIFREATSPSQLIYTDGIGEPTTPRPEAVVTVTFEELPGGRTILTKSSVAPLQVHQFLAAGLGLLHEGNTT